MSTSTAIFDKCERWAVVLTLLAPLLAVWFLWPFLSEWIAQRRRKQDDVDPREDRLKAVQTRAAKEPKADVESSRTSSKQSSIPDLSDDGERFREHTLDSLGYFAALDCDYEWFLILSFLDPASLARLETASFALFSTKTDLGGGRRVFALAWRVAYVQPYHARPVTFFSTTASEQKASSSVATPGDHDHEHFSVPSDQKQDLFERYVRWRWLNRSSRTVTAQSVRVQKLRENLHGGEGKIWRDAYAVTK